MQGATGLQFYYFIALIDPIQWTNAYPVGTEKDVLCFHRLAGP